MPTVKPPTEPTVLCGICQETEVNNPGSDFCEICSTPLCEDCIYSHNRLLGHFYCEECDVGPAATP